MKEEILKTYAAWTRAVNSNFKFCTMLVKAKNSREAKKMILESGQEIEENTKVYLVSDKAKTRKSVHLYCIQKDCADGTCTIDVETFPKTEEGLNEAYRRLAELNSRKNIHYLRLIKV